MGSLTSLTDHAALIIADASVIISLNATGCASDIIRALPNRIAVVDVVMAELETGRPRGRQDADQLKPLISAGLVDLVKLCEESEQHFEGLVVGPAAETLDDGEAATIAYAIAHSAIALIDERKATRICSERFPSLRIGCTVDIFLHPRVQEYLGNEAVADAVFNALVHGRTRVFSHHIEWIVGLIGTARTALCSSLPSSARAPPVKLAVEE